MAFFTIQNRSEIRSKVSGKHAKLEVLVRKFYSGKDLGIGKMTKELVIYLI